MDFDNILSSVFNELAHATTKLDGVRGNIFYIPKELCDLSVDESLYNIQEEMRYKNYLQLKDGVYKVVDRDGNILQ